MRSHARSTASPDGGGRFSRMSRWLVTGGAGFIGANTVRALSEAGHEAVIFDNLSRATTPLNLEWLADRAELVRGDVRDVSAVDGVFRDHGPFDVVLHLAGQVAVTTSVADPATDFQTNAAGSFAVLDATRRLAPEAVLLNASTNKVYGQLEHHAIEELPTRYVDATAPEGVSESAPLDPHSPYGCSKAAADVYALDYARIYGLRAVSLRQSCIYGPRQFGVEDQGWVAWFAMARRLGRPVTIYGTGKQVRDLLHIDDLVRLYLRVAERPDACAGRAYNIGGGPANTLSLLELLERLEQWRPADAPPASAPARAGDQLVFVADGARARADLGWEPSVSLDDGIPSLLEFVDANAERAAGVLAGA
jgi:CDP-paratose 2-epimerase